MAEAWPINKWEHTNTSSLSSSRMTLRLGANTGSPSKPSSSTPSPWSNPSTSAASSQTQTATTPSVPPVTAIWPWPQQATAEPPACGPRIDARILPLPSCNLTLPSLCPTVSTRRSANAVTVFPSPSPRAQTSNRPEPWGRAENGAPRPSGTSDHLHTLTPRSAWKAQTTAATSSVPPEHSATHNAGEISFDVFFFGVNSCFVNRATSFTKVFF